MNITPAPKGAAASICQPDGGTAGSDPPPGYLYCQHGFSIFTAGSAEALQACLSMISVVPAEACNPKIASACIDEMYKAACSTVETDTLCKDTETQCGMIQEMFDGAGCAYQLKTFNDTALKAYVTCFNDKVMTMACQDAHNACYDAALVIAP